MPYLNLSGNFFNYRLFNSSLRINKLPEMKTLTHLRTRGFSTSVYLWTSMPRLGPKATEIKQQFAIPKGTP